MLDLLYLNYNRCKFAEASLRTLLVNTDWSLVRRIWFYDDGSTDGALELLTRFRWPVPYEAVMGNFFRAPVASMNDFIWQRSRAGVFAKLDSDVIVPPGWLGVCAEVMERNPHLDLLGIEPPMSRTPAPWANGRRLPAPESYSPLNISGYAPCDAIGGIGLMRRSAFTGRAPMKPHSTHGGFQDWQLAHPEVRKGWVVPPLRLFLLDRLPVEPWASLSREYIAQGWQRPWTNYTMADSALWDWWEGTHGN